MTIVPKSGWPVLGQTAVNSGQVISISYSRSGNWFGNVSSVAIGRLLGLARPTRVGTPPTRPGPARPGPPRSIVTEAPRSGSLPRDPRPSPPEGGTASQLLFAARPPRGRAGDSASRRGSADCGAPRGWTLDSSPPCGKC